MMPDSSKYYVSNYLGDTISVICGPYPKAGCQEKTLNLLDDNADNSGYFSNGRYLSLSFLRPDNQRRSGRWVFGANAGESGREVCGNWEYPVRDDYHC